MKCNIKNKYTRILSENRRIYMISSYDDHTPFSTKTISNVRFQPYYKKNTYMHIIFSKLIYNIRSINNTCFPFHMPIYNVKICPKNEDETDFYAT